MNNILISKLNNRFREVFQAEPLIVRSPGRINFIGEHTDYNDGFVLPAAINKAIYFAAAANNKSTIEIISVDFNESIEIDIKNLVKTGKQWGDYLAGTINEMLRMNYPLRGFNCMFGGDIPIGAGLSSSAAIAAGIAYTINELFNLNIPKKDLAVYAQMAEHNFAGVNCGIMDQFISLYGEKNKAMKLDCRSLAYEMYDFDYPDVSVILCDSGIKHALASTEYNLRRKQCEAGVLEIRKKYQEVKNLRDVNIGMLEEFERILSPDIYSKCLYVIEENFRVSEACEQLKKKNINGFGELMTLTHEGLKEDYEVSIPELDDLVYQSLELPGVYGSRMMGGGFGGCTINIVAKTHADDFRSKMKTFYTKSKGIYLKIYDCDIEGGTAVI
jgi:galactokinase